MRTTLPNSIEPGEGLGPLQFGATRAEVRKLLGQPAASPDCSIEGWETWNYPYHAIEVTFCADADWRCTRLWTDRADYLIQGRVVLGVPIAQLARLSSALGPCVGKIDPDLGPSLEFPEADIEIGLADDISDQITWHAHIDEADEYVFPGPGVAV